MLYESLQAWRLLHTNQQYPVVWLVLHTSCVNYKLRDLEAAANLDFFWVLPSGVRQELELLLDSPLYGKRAAFVLSHVFDWPPSGATWDLELFYSTKEHPGILPSQIFSSDPAFFLFGNLAKQEEFLRHISDLPEWQNHYLLYNNGWNCTRGDSMVLSVSQAKGLPLRRTQVLSSNIPMPPLSELPLLNISTGDSCFLLDRTTLRSTGQAGSFAQIYTSTACPNRLIKLYKCSAAVGTQRQKLETLQRLASTFRHLPLALPRELIFSEDNLVGYTMTPCPGCPISNLIKNGFDGYDFEQICKNLARLLVELHSLHILVNDLSFNNILVDIDNQVYLVDCDSFQLTDCPGGSITYLYQHPEIQENHFYDTCREPYQEYFAFAVLMFQCICRCENPLAQALSAECEDKITWSNARFPLRANCSSNTGHANQATYENWTALPLKLQQAFDDEFHFQRIHNIGAWLQVFSS